MIISFFKVKSYFAPIDISYRNLNQHISLYTTCSLVIFSTNQARRIKPTKKEGCTARGGYRQCEKADDTDSGYVSKSCSSMME